MSLERLRFLYIARGSLAETLSAFVIAESFCYCSDEQLNRVRQLKKKIKKNLNGYCRFIKSQQQGKSEYGNKYVKD